MAHEQSDSRAEVVSRVRAALGRSTTKQAPPPPAVNEAIARLARADDDLPAKFIANATAVGLHVHHIDADALFDTIRAQLQEHKARHIAIAMRDHASISARLRAEGFEVFIPASRADIDHQFDCDAGITDVHAALAETGTLVCTSDAQHSRGPSLIPPLHIAIVHERDLLPDMIDFWARFRETSATALPSSIAFITGPSKTADIEGILIVGVHGPQYVHVMLVRD